MNNKHPYFFKLMQDVASNSRDTSTKVGCVIVGPDDEIRSTGYNDFVRGVDDTRSERRDRPLKYKWTEHSERNAIYNAARIGVSLKGCSAYVSWIPCTDCMRGLIQSGLKVIYIDKSNYKNNKQQWDERWGDDIKISCEMANEAGLKIEFV